MPLYVRQDTVVVSGYCRCCGFLISEPEGTQAATCRQCAAMASQTRRRAGPEVSQENDPSAARHRADTEAPKLADQANNNMLRCPSTADLAGVGGFSKLYEPEPQAAQVQAAAGPTGPLEACPQPSRQVVQMIRNVPRPRAPPGRAVLGEITNTAPTQATQVAAAPAPAPAKRDAAPPQATQQEVTDDPQYVAEYAPDVLQVMLRRQMAFMPRANYMGTQRELNSKMRAILTDWLFEVHHKKYKMRRETLFLTVNVIDRYLSARDVPRDRLQLVGVAATLIAAKYEEIHPPEVQDFINVTAMTYSRKEILDTEMTIINALAFQVACPTAAYFLSHYQASYKMFPLESRRERTLLDGSPWDAHSGDLAWYIMELGLLDISLILFPPSHLAAAALLLSNAISGFSPRWPDFLARSTGHEEAALRDCVGQLRVLLTQAPTSELQAVQNHYRRGVREAS